MQHSERAHTNIDDLAVRAEQLLDLVVLNVRAHVAVEIIPLGIVGEDEDSIRVEKCDRISVSGAQCRGGRGGPWGWGEAVATQS